MKHYAVLNPMTGQYTKAANQQELLSFLSDIALSFYLSQTHNQPYSVVEVLPDGSEQWSAPNGDPVLSPTQFKAELEKQLRAKAQFPVTGRITTTQL